MGVIIGADEMGVIIGGWRDRHNNWRCDGMGVIIGDDEMGVIIGADEIGIIIGGVMGWV